MFNFFLAVTDTVTPVVTPTTWDSLTEWLFPVVIIIGYVIATVFGKKILDNMKAKSSNINDSRLAYLASWAVKCVEQTLTKAASKEKLSSAVDHLTKLAKEEGITVSPEKATVLIETVVFELNSVIKKEPVSSPTDEIKK